MTSSPAPEQRCYRHADREAYIACQRCERLICPLCMNEASVGFQCPECLRSGAKSVRTPRTIAGGVLSTRPGVVSLSLIVVNVVLFLLQSATGMRDGVVYREGAMLSVSGVTADGHDLTGVADGAYWRLLTAAFLHNGIVHLALNMVALYLFGPVVERALGTWRFLVAYLAMAVTSSVVVYWLSPIYTTTVGASGAIFGLFAVTFVLMLRARQNMTPMLVLLGINAVWSFQANISWQGHLGGFVAGLVLAAIVMYAPRERRQLAQIVALAALVAFCAVVIVLRTAALT